MQSRKSNSPPTPVWVNLAWLALAASLLPVGINVGLPFQVSPADVVLPLMVPVVLLGLPSPAIARLLGLLVGTSLVILLIWAVVDDGGVAQIQSWLFFWKSWVAVLLAYGLIMRAPKPREAVRRVLNLVVIAQGGLIVLILMGWATQGALISGAVSSTGLDVTGFTAGTWSYPIALYGYGQVNATANLLTLAAPLAAYRLSLTSNVFLRVFWLSWIPVSWWLIINSGSRGSLITAGLFIACLPFASKAGLRHISVGRVFLTLATALIIISQAQLIIDASPKYARTLNELASGNTAAASSGRNELNALVIEDLSRSPVFGTAFGDFERFHTSAETIWINSSPHNAYLGPIHKMGLPLGVGYLILLWRTLPLFRVKGFVGLEFLTLPFAVPLLLGVLPVGDALTTSVLAATILTVCGCLLAARQITTSPEPDQSVGRMVGADPKTSSKA